MHTDNSSNSSETDGPVTSAAKGQLDAGVSLWQPAMTLWKREMVRFFRQRSRIIGALMTPIFFWILLGTGLNRNFVLDQSASKSPPAEVEIGSDDHQKVEISGVNAGLENPDQAGQPVQEVVEAGQDVGYLAYFFPGTVIMIVLFTAIFSMFSVIEDRREGFMQAVLVSPAPRLGIVLGKVLGCASIATIQGTLFLLAWPLVRSESMASPIAQTIGHILLAMVAMFAVGLSLAAFSLCLAWKINSTQGFHAIMNLLLMPMWFLCGAVFPVPESGYLMKYIMMLNPLTYGHAVFTGALTGDMGHTGVNGPIWLSPVLLIVGMVLAFIVASKTVTQQGKEAAA